MVRRRPRHALPHLCPGGAHRDLLAYLVRRLLENGANSSFVNQIVDDLRPAARSPPIRSPRALGERRIRVSSAGGPVPPERANSRGFDLHDRRRGSTRRATLRRDRVDRGPILAVAPAGAGRRTGGNPAARRDWSGTCHPDRARPMWSARIAAAALVRARAQRARRSCAAPPISTRQRGRDLRPARARGRQDPADAVAELREAVDFLRYYAARRAPARGAGPRAASSPASARGTSRWPSSPARSPPRWPPATPCWPNRRRRPRSSRRARPRRSCMRPASRARRCSFCQGDGPTVGAALTSDPRIDGVAFTGSTETARRDPPRHGRQPRPRRPLIAETGGLNAMIVDSAPRCRNRRCATSSPRPSSRRASAARRCAASTCRRMWRTVSSRCSSARWTSWPRRSMGPRTDIGPVIDAEAQGLDRRLCRRGGGRGAPAAPPRRAGGGHLRRPLALIRGRGIADLEREVFGPVLHVATFKAEASTPSIARSTPPATA
jgi:RHH-type proline utilization regulon transcriptional repressor/proline dehydrogenase/delta 1-pyrroline-5-carboxylate dehydrogenase